MKPEVTGDKYLELRYDRDLDILYVLIPGRKIEASNEVTSPLIIDFGSEDDGFDVVGFELHAASEYLAPVFTTGKAEITTP